MKRPSKKLFFTIFFIAIFITISSLVVFYVYKQNSVETLSKYGSRGNEVTQIQTKLSTKRYAWSL